jgi:hypothetical protein
MMQQASISAQSGFDRRCCTSSETATRERYVATYALRALARCIHCTTAYHSPSPLDALGMPAYCQPLGLGRAGCGMPMYMLRGIYVYYGRAHARASTAWAGRCTDAKPATIPVSRLMRQRAGRECVPHACGAVRMCACQGTELRCPHHLSTRLVATLCSSRLGGDGRGATDGGGLASLSPSSSSTSQRAR